VPEPKWFVQRGYAVSAETTSAWHPIVAVQVTQRSPVPARCRGLRRWMNGVLINDFAAWYAEPVDVTSDGMVNDSDVAAMAWLVGVSTVDADLDDIVDAVEVWQAIAAVETPAAMKAAQLHPARPNPFNPASSAPTDAGTLRVRPMGKRCCGGESPPGTNLGRQNQSGQPWRSTSTG
jgi:hypothetical protein